MKLALVTASSLNLRDKPGMAGAVIATLPRETRVEILGAQGVWYEIRTGAQRGFAHGDYLRIIEAPSLRGFLKDQSVLRALPLLAPKPLPVDPKADATHRGTVRIWNAFGGLLGPLSDMLEMDRASAVAILYVESGGKGFGADGRLIIRFENHVFFREWGKVNAAAYGKQFQHDEDKPWTNHLFRAKSRGDWQPLHNGSQESEWTAFTAARALAEVPALRSISLGLPQTMGFNHALVGYDSARALFEAYSASLAAQVLGLFDFIKGREPTSEALQAIQRRQYHRLAELYNGKGQAAQYAVLIERAATTFGLSV